MADLPHNSYGTRDAIIEDISADALRQIAIACYGTPSTSSAREMRWGTHGSLCLNLQKRVYFDHEAGEGGGILDFVIRSGVVTDISSALGLLQNADRNQTYIHGPEIKSGISRASSAHASAIWAQAHALDGTIAQSYLESRSLPGPWPEALRFHPALPCQEARCKLPALLGKVTDLKDTGKVLAIHRLWLGPDGRKANIATPKKVLGPISGRGILLGELGPELCIAEGVESALSIARELDLPGVATLGAAGMVALEIPKSVRRVVIAFDRDASGIGEVAANKLAARLYSLEHQVEFTPPPDNFNDWNDYLVGVRP